MQFIRTAIWVVLAAVLVAFVAINWEEAPVNFWPLADGTYLHFNWPVGFTALVFFFVGLIPMWLLNKAGRWRFNRRINALENSVRAAAPPPPLATSSQLEPANPEDKTA